MLTGKTVWITGASSGLGEALAIEAANRGAKLILSARSEDKLQTLAKTLPSTAEAKVVPLDLSKPDTLHAAAAQVDNVDFLINNGGISQRSHAADTDQEVVRRIMEINFFGQVELTKLVLPKMLAQNSGHIAVMSSLVGYFGTPLRSAYSASKHALHGYYDSLRFEVEDRGLKVTLICPGFIKTNISINAVVGDGSPQGTMDNAQANGMEPSQFAKIVWKGLLQNKKEIYVGGSEIGGIYLKRFVPSIFRAILRRRSVT